MQPRRGAKYTAIENIMNLTINCIRVPIPRGTIFDGMPLEIGPAQSLKVLNLIMFLQQEPMTEHLSILLDEVLPMVTRKDHPLPLPLPTLKLLKCNRKTILSTFNVRTLGPKGRLDELEQCAQASAIDIVAQEHKFHHPNGIQSSTSQLANTN